VAAVVAETDPDVFASAEGVGWIKTDDTLLALQQFAAEHRKRFSIPVIAVTGSNGKTIVKEWLAQLLAPEMAVCRSPLSYNSRVGVPLSVLQLSPAHQIAIFEAGISMPGEMEPLNHIINPTVGLFTGIGAAHDENFSGRMEKTKEKLKLFKGCTHLVCFDDSSEVFNETVHFANQHNIRLFTIGTGQSSTLQVPAVDVSAADDRLTLCYGGEVFSIRLPFTDFASRANTLLCTAALLLRGYDTETITRRIPALEPVAMRMEQSEGINRCIIINDSYNNDLVALGIAMEHLHHNKARHGKTLILSDIFQSGLNEAALVQEVSHLLNRYMPDKFIGIGPVMSGLKGLVKGQTWFYENTEHFLRYHPFSVFREEVILLKGARSFRFERIRDALQSKSHDTVLEINLGALVHNLNFFRSLLPKATRIMAMVKASSYGSGNFEIAHVLQYQQVDYLGVAYADEGAELRRAGIRLPIMVMSPEQGAFHTLIESHLEPELYSFSILNDFIRFLEHNFPAMSAPYPVHIEVNTGMNRLGFEPDDLPRLCHMLNQTRSVVVRSVFSHLASAHDPSPDGFARQQTECFSRAGKVFLEAYRHGKPLLHLLNSDGMIQFPDAVYDMVRPGIGLYGFVSDHNVRKQLQPTHTLKSVILQIREIRTGETVGYNSSFTAKHPTKVATVAIGYADGFNRKLGNGNFSVKIGGRTAKVIGDVCMDMIMVDITGMPGIREGDDVVVFDHQTLVDTMCQILETIPYEILTSISPRVKRVFLSE
jgi:Alr-MurF fusion protein